MQQVDVPYNFTSRGTQPVAANAASCDGERKIAEENP